VVVSNFPLQSALQHESLFFIAGFTEYRKKRWKTKLYLIPEILLTAHRVTTRQRERERERERERMAIDYTRVIAIMFEGAPLFKIALKDYLKTSISSPYIL
jgi:hypothetical protein|tara:strand:- start:335 stop:637 length:303 start_codon:yes stop_codon:yes gene_type:complete